MKPALSTRLYIVITFVTTAGVFLAGAFRDVGVIGGLYNPAVYIIYVHKKVFQPFTGDGAGAGLVGFVSILLSICDISLVVWVMGYKESILFPSVGQS